MCSPQQGWRSMSPVTRRLPSTSFAARIGACRRSRPVRFECYVEDVQRAKVFYSTVIGWTFEKWAGPMPYWPVTSGTDDEAGINGGLRQRLPHEGVGMVSTVTVESVDAASEAVRAAGGTLLVEEMSVFGLGWLAYAMDTEGMVFGILQPDVSAT